LKKIFLVVLLILSVMLVGCGREVAVTVNGKKIYEDDVEKRLEVLVSQYPQMTESLEGDAEEELKGTIIDSLISEVLIAEEAVKQKVEVSEDEVDSKIKEIKAGFPDEKSFLDALEENKMTLADLKGEIEKSLVQLKMMEKITADVKTTESELKEYYEENGESFVEPEQVKVKHILLEDEKTAEKVLAELKSGSDFAELAGKYSTDPGFKDKGGDLGWMSRDQLVPEFADAAFSLPVGQLSSLVKSQFGYHIIIVEEKKETVQQDFNDVKEDVEQILLEEKRSDKFQMWIEDLKKKADIKKNT